MTNRLTFEDVTTKFPTTDKAGHGYLYAYNGFLPDKIDKLLEVGVWKGDGIRMLKHFYNGEGEYHCVNYQFGENGIPSIEEFEAEGIKCHVSRDDDVETLSKITEQFDVIIEDAHHTSDSQIICFKQLFLNNLKRGGVYFMEDLHCCNYPEWWRSIKSFEDTALHLFRRVQMGGTFESQLISAEEDKLIRSQILTINVIGGFVHGTIGIVCK